MALTINLPNTVEQQLRKEAASKGISLDNYLLRLLQQATKFSQKITNNNQLSESELLNNITLDITENEWATYKHLIGIRRAENLTEQQYEDLIALSDKIEVANAKRLHYLAELAQLRSISLDKLMHDLDIKPVEV